MNALISMTASGTFLLLFYFLVRKMVSKYLGVKWNYYLVWISLLFYLLPVSVLSFFLPAGENTISSALEGTAVHSTIRMNPTMTLYCTENGSYFIRENILWLTIIFLWTAGILACLIYNVKEYWSLKKFVTRNMVIVEGGSAKRIFEDCKERLHVKRKVILATSRWISTPMVIGVIKPVLLLPETSVSEDKLKLVIAHEMIHIRKRHVIVKWLGVAANAIHWFNPLAYILKSEINKCSEYDCDGTMVKDMDKEERKWYGFTLLEFTAPASFCGRAVSMFAEDNKRQMKERLEYIMNIKEITRRITATASALLLSVGIFGVAAAIACESPVTVHMSSANEWKEEVDNGVLTTMSFSSDAAAANIEANPLTLADSLLSVEKGINGVFISDDGVVIYPSASTRTICSHSCVAGTYTAHIKYPDGHCKTVDYPAEWCKKCDDIFITGSPTKTVTYTKCPH